MKKCILFLLVVLNFTAFQIKGQQSGRNYVEGELLVQFSKPGAVNRLVSDYRSFGLKIKHRVSERFNIYLLEFDRNASPGYRMIEALKKEKSVVHVQNNHFVSLREAGETSPNDSLFGYQWALDNYGQGGGVFDADIDATDAWDITTGGLTADGDTIVVAIIDGGSDIYHEDLDIWVNYGEIPNNNIDDDSNGYVDDRNGWNAYSHSGDIPFHQHGTHVGGIAGARGNNQVGVTGVNWNVKILPVAASSTTESIVVEGLSYVYVLRERYDQTGGEEGAFVIADNCSFGVDQGQPEDFPIWEAMYDSLGKLGVISVGATANINWDIDEMGDVPTAFTTPYMIAVTNTTNKDVKYTSAGYGDTTIDLGAPGTNILSTRLSDQYGNSTGTSMAAPHVTGALALLLSAADTNFMAGYKNNPSESALLLREHILNGVDLLASLMGKTVTGGRLNVFNAINLLQSAPELYVDKDSIISQLPLNTVGYESLLVMNAGGDTLNYTLSFENNPGWIEAQPPEGSLTGSESDEISITLNSEGLDTGMYLTTLTIEAPNVASRYIPVKLEVFNDVGVTDITKKQSSIQIFPNPFHSKISLSLKANGDENCRFDLFNAHGEKVVTKIFDSGNITTEIDTGTLPAGIYYYRITQESTTMGTGKLTKL